MPWPLLEAAQFKPDLLCCNRARQVITCQWTSLHVCRFFYAASAPLLVAAIIYGLSYMPSRRSSWAVKLDVGLAWFSALSVLILVPTDVASTLQVGKSPCKWLQHLVHGTNMLFQLPIMSAIWLDASMSKTCCHIAGDFTTIVSHMVEGGLLVWLCSPIYCPPISPGIRRLRPFYHWRSHQHGCQEQPDLLCCLDSKRSCLIIASAVTLESVARQFRLTCTSHAHCTF